MASFAPYGYEGEGVSSIRPPVVSPFELAALVEGGEATIVDCRFSLADLEAGRRAYRTGHVPGAVYAHLEEDLSAPVVPGKTGRHPWPSVEAMVDRLERWGIANPTHVVAYDDATGAIAARLWMLLTWLGHDAVQVLDGGYTAWLEAKGPTTAEIPRPRRARFVPQPRRELLADATEIERIRSSTAHRLFDARAANRFRGDEEPIDPVAGHIPGARCLPFEGNVENGRLRSPDALRARYREALAGVAAKNAVVYCGSGVTACHDILAAAHAGIDGLRLYPGSWSEWITSPERGIATGAE